MSKEKHSPAAGAPKHKNKFSKSRRPHNAKPSAKAGQGGRGSAKSKASIWGSHAVNAAWANPARSIKSLYITEQALTNFAPIMDEAAGAALVRPVPQIMDKKQIDRLVPPGAVHQGIALDAEPLEEVFLQDLIIAATTKEKSCLLILDQVTDPHNVGAIIRSACALGADGIIMQRRHAPELTGVLLKTASGAAEYIPVAYEINLANAIETLRQNGFSVLGLDERGPQTIGEAEKPDKTALVLGAEGKGLRPKVADYCSALVRLPTEGPVASLNVSNAAAVALYALLSR